MVYRITLSLSLLAAPLCLKAQTADDYFHGGAQSYIHAQTEKAQQEIMTGLQKFPQDPKLNGLAALLKKKEEEQKQQQQQQQQQQDQQKDQKEDQKKKEQQQQQDKQDQKQDSSEPKQDQAKSDDQKQQQAKQDQQQKEQQKKEEQQQQANQSADKPDEKSGDTNTQAYAIGQMTPEQAQQLLDTQKNAEKLLPVKPTGKPVDRSRPIKDW